MNPTKEKFYARNRQEWRNWLEQNYQQAREIYLVYYKKSSGKPTLTYEESVEEALCYGWIDGVRNSLDEESYMMRFSPRRKGSIWSKVNCERVEAAIAAGKMTPAGMKTIEEAKKNGQWEAAYRMKDKQEIPEDFKAALLQKPVAWENFNKFSNSVQFTFITRVAGIKGAVLRAEKIRKAVELCEQNLQPYGPDRKPRF